MCICNSLEINALRVTHAGICPVPAIRKDMLVLSRAIPHYKILTTIDNLKPNLLKMKIV